MHDYRSTHDGRLQGWKGRIVRYWPEVISTFASLTAIITLIIAVFRIEEKTTLELIYITELSVFAVFLLGYVISQEYRFSRKARYAEAMYSIHSCIHFLRDYQFDFKNLSNEIDCKHALSKVITSFANAFSMVTGTHCRACIKTIELRDVTPESFQSINVSQERANHLYINTFCRDSSTAAQLDSSDDSYIHPIIGNTDFLELYLNPDLRMFFNNNLLALQGYQNTSLQRNVKLPYKSSIVWPIRKLVYEQDGETGNPLNQKQDIIGFLCVDSSRKNVFRQDYDFEMGATIADAVFTFLKNYHNFLDDLNKE